VDKASGQELRMLDAIEQHIVDDVAGTVKDTQTNRVYDFGTAVRNGLVKEEPMAIESVFEDRRTSRTSVGSGTFIIFC